MTHNQGRLLFIVAIFAASVTCHAVTKPPIKPADELTISGNSIPANPAAVNILTGTGELQTFLEKQLNIQNNHGIRIGGTFTGDVNQLFSGGIPGADRSTTNSLLQLGLSIDTEKFSNLKGGLFDAEVLQFNGQATNAQAGTVQGYNGLPGAPPLNRFEIYKLWYRQALFDNHFFVRIGKTVPSMDFDNVVKPVPIRNERLEIPAVSGLIYTPLYVNASMLGVMPGYYNSAYGITLNLIPTHHWSLSYGVYDGNLAEGKQTGLTGPNINGAYFHIGELAVAWGLGKQKLPGDVAIGLWRQTGLIQSSPTLFEHGASGGYLYGTQRLWYKNR
jgi:porin